MLLSGSLRLIAGASAVWRQARPASGTSERKLADILSHLVSGTGSGICVPLPLSLQSRRLSALLGPASFSSVADDSTLVPMLRESNDEALSPHPSTTGTSPLTIRYPFAVQYYKDSEAVVLSLDEQPLGLVRLPGAAFNVPVRLDILYRVVRYWRAKWQQGTHKAKRRGEVRGGGRKPWPQKKTGRARQGSIRSPLWKGGGVSHAPLPRSHAHKLPRAMQLRGMRCALSAKVREGRFFVVDDFLRIRAPTVSLGGPGAGPNAASTTALCDEARVRDYSDLKQRLTHLTAGSFGSTWLLVDNGESGRDGGVRLRKWLKGRVMMEVMAPEQLTVYHVLKYHRLVVTRAALGSIVEALSKPHRMRKLVKHAWWMQRKAQLEASVLELTKAAARDTQRRT
ncbi:hypothetical protein Vretimale_3948 [Volvox reticuliferus]|uniref:Large ribosomal subunit protein uL4m n=1 Tax=Volvox reticuliferus TaxID=1737510 RepID=A0A8J4G4W3_9CHLO|nr:hypothetical protein Vretifemale_1558 [Volvox reticuliferus]GIL98601.1 hypothetical protein Vretimale_3948 [Volvox reticuliferus]